VAERRLEKVVVLTVINLRRELPGNLTLAACSGVAANALARASFRGTSLSVTVKEVAGLLCLVETGAWQEKFGTAWSIEDAAQAEMHECGVDESLDNPRHDGDIAGGPSKEQGGGLVGEVLDTCDIVSHSDSASSCDKVEELSNLVKIMIVVT